MNFLEHLNSGISYIIGLGPSVMMPIIFTIIGILLGVKVAKAVRSGLYVGVGFIGLNVITNLLTSNLGPAVQKLADIYGLQTDILDIGWPAAAEIAYTSSVGALVIPVCLIINLVLLLVKGTKTVNIDIWNFWHHAFIGSIVAVATDSVVYGLYAAIICYVLSLVMADFTADRFAKFYDKMDGISIPQPFVVAFAPFAWLINKGLDFIPGMNKINIDAEGMKKKFGLLGEPIFLGVIIGCLLGGLARYEFADVLKLGVVMGAVMELIPRITSLFIEGLVPISEATKELIKRKFAGKTTGFLIGMSPALVIGHPATLVVTILLIPVLLFLSVALPGNKFLPLTSLAGLLYVFPMILPYTKGNVFKTFLIGLIMMVAGNYIATGLAGIFTEAAHQTGTIAIADGQQVACIDFAASPLTWVIYQFTANLKLVGSILIGIFTLGLVVLNRQKNVIIKK
ncbi:PTS system Galactitol-specific IIC component [Bacteroides coprosuis DSM 18011]|uniref:PTS system Galactitol-specific IIC component n=1 Tax=Bacteroides coprosuis DSM 18011 TaxID=679937 RepID=F3ZSK0_9BACE|nr:PTS sugar transporter subunit IIC [Bacteroides coprosuis]EGJ72152.1 PTS system Galactitol-specific IIC component [Bacteroides coprosuis DSM 18011]